MTSNLVETLAIDEDIKTKSLAEQEEYLKKAIRFLFADEQSYYGNEGVNVLCEEITMLVEWRRRQLISPILDALKAKTHMTLGEMVHELSKRVKALEVATKALYQPPISQAKDS